MAEAKYGKVTLERKPDLDPDEPLFVLRAQDVLAPIVVHYYAELWAATHSGLAGVNGAMRIRDTAEAMTAWPKRKIPD